MLKVGEEAESGAALAVEGGGRYAILGLISAHRHILWPSVFELIPDIASALRRQVERDFEECPVHGVTTVREIGTLPLTLKRWRERVEPEELPGPRAYTAGLLINAPGSCPADYIKPRPAPLAARWGNTKISVASRERIFRAVGQAVDQEACVIEKALDESSLLMGQEPLSTLSSELLAALLEEAHSRGLKSCGPTPIQAGLRKALRCEADELQHITTDAELDDADIEAFMEGDHGIVPAFSGAWALACPRPGDPIRDNPEARGLMRRRAESALSIYLEWASQPSAARCVAWSAAVTTRPSTAIAMRCRCPIPRSTPGRRVRARQPGPPPPRGSAHRPRCDGGFP